MADEEDPKAERHTPTAKQNANSTNPFTSVNAPSTSTSKSARAASKSPPATRQSRLSEAAAKNAPPDSQPMTKTPSSQSAEHLANNHADTNGPSPYGTRSRNRAGASRPNYAEDRDPDADYEWPSSKKSQGVVSEPAPANNTAPMDHEKTSGTNTRRSSTAATAVPASAAASASAAPANAPTSATPTSKASSALPPSHQIPGMSSFSVHPEGVPPPVTHTRKRKAPGSNQHVQHPTSATTAPVQGAGTLRKHASTATPQQTARQTNLMTFETSRAYLKGGKLKADDGTLLGVNGRQCLAQFCHAMLN